MIEMTLKAKHSSKRSDSFKASPGPNLELEGSRFLGHPGSNWGEALGTVRPTVKLNGNMIKNAQRQRVIRK